MLSGEGRLIDNGDSDRRSGSRVEVAQVTVSPHNHSWKRIIPGKQISTGTCVNCESDECTQFSFFFIIPSASTYAEYLGGDATFSGISIGIPTVVTGIVLVPMVKIDQGSLTYLSSHEWTYK